MDNQGNVASNLVEVARLYYENEMSQQEIADRLGVSRSLIALYLKKAREQGIVRFSIVDPQDHNQDLAMHICEAFELHRVSVVPSSHNSDLLTRRSIASAVARYLEGHLQDGDVIGLGWGRTTIEISNLLAPSRPVNIDVVPLLGESGSSYTGSYSQVNQIIMQSARSFNGRPHFLLAPLLVSNAALRQQLCRDASIQPTTQLWNQLDYACMGIGSIPPSPGQVVYIGEENVEAFAQNGAVGDICARYFDINGNYIQAPLNERLIGIDVEQLRKTKRVIAAASGIEKAKATIAVLRSKIITDLFVDEELANAMLEELNQPALEG
jgi:deoxyribonucleoside regulator